LLPGGFSLLTHGKARRAMVDFRYVPPWPGIRYPYAMNTDPKVVYEFGPFRMDPDKQVLLRDGQLIAVTPKGFETLLVLVRRGREVVSKEELLKEIWPDSFVEEANLSQHIFKLRKALGDTLEGERYIVTLPGRGYRFAVPVRTITEGGEVLIAQMRSRAQIVIEEHASKPVETQPVALPPPAHAKPKWRKWLLRSAIAAAIAIAGLGLLLLLRHHQTSRALTETDTVVLADFANSTGDPVFDGTLRQGMAVQLEQSPFWSVISEQRMQQTLRLMGRPADARINRETAREICARTGSAAVLEGSIASLGTQYVLGLRAENCRSGDILADEQAQAARKEDVLGALDKTAIRLRSKLGESLNSVEKYATPVEEATTPSLEALNAYSLGRKVFFEKGNTAALPYLQRAVELDPNFAIAYRALGAMYLNLNQPGRMAENVRKAYELREKVSERERFYIESTYYWMGTGELEKAITVEELWRQSYPRDYALYVHLGVIYTRLGNLEKALEETRESVRLEPNSGINYMNLCIAYIYLDRLDEAEAVVKQAEERKLESEGLLGARYQLAFLKGDTAQMAHTVSAAMGKPGTEDVLLDAQANTEAWHGRWKDARQLTRRAMSSAEQNEARETAAGYEARMALGEVESGMREEARSDAYAAIKLASNRDVLERVALTLALAGDTAAAEKLAAELDRTFPLDTLVQRYRLPAITAAVALQHKDAKRAVELLQVTSPIELGDNGEPFPIYLRGEAYLMLHDGNAAAAEFQKFIDHRGRVGNFPWGALARLQLARACALSGDKTKAKIAYQDFLTLWKNADPDIPALKQAKAEYAKLQ
jgi:DNA-binding winged helix-turn-helix (wHTH) protein/tetratricopeptide (TPR) repeat protein